MAIELRLPALPNTEAVTIDRWLKQAGDSIRAREKLLEAHSAQFDWDIPAPHEVADSTLQTIHASAGQCVKVGDVLAEISIQSSVVSSQIETQDSAVSAQDSARMTPVAARIAEEYQVDLSQVQGTGLGGRITKEDVLALIAVQRPKPVLSIVAGAISQPTNLPTLERDTWIEQSHVQRARAEQVSRSKRTIPHVTSFVEIDLGSVRAQIEARQGTWQRREGFLLDELPFIVQASAVAVRTVPIIASAFTSNGVAIKKQLHIGISGATDASPLQTIVVADADHYNLVGIARRIRSAHEDAIATFTIDARGLSTGALFYSGVVMEGQAATLGIGAVQPRAAIAAERVAICPLCYLSLSYDHRVIDGIVAGQFLSELKRLLETSVW